MSFDYRTWADSWGDSWAYTWGNPNAIPEQAPPPGGVGKRYKKRKRVLIENKTYWVQSAFEEAMLVQSYLRELEERYQQTDSEKIRKSLRLVIRKKQRDLAAIQPSLDVPVDIPNDDDEVIELYMATRVLH